MPDENNIIIVSIVAILAIVGLVTMVLSVKNTSINTQSSDAVGAAMRMDYGRCISSCDVHAGDLHTYGVCTHGCMLTALS